MHKIKRYRIKKYHILILLILVLFIAGCSKTRTINNPSEASSAVKFVRSGSQGVYARFMPNSPPYQSYDDSQLNVILELTNRGAYDLSPRDCRIVLTGYDPSIFDFTGCTTSTKGGGCSQECSKDTLYGKSATFPEGGLFYAEFTDDNVLLPNLPGFDFYRPNLVANLCYSYKTEATAQVCVDPQFYSVTNEQKSCLVRDVGLGTQGAPVAVSDVEVSMSNNLAHFKITVTNVGGGKVFSNYVSIDNCPSGLEYTDIDELTYSISMGAGSMVSCSPQDDKVRLNNGVGTIFCTFDVGNGPAFETPLSIELDYNYMDSVRKEIEIVKVPGRR